MPLAPQTHLGPYEILAPIGAGGMGEVYRARDVRLGRDVALKVLPEIFSKDAERMARFEREAQVLASLNHPNIGCLYGLEESNGVRALVMELVEGPTLAERIATRPDGHPGSAPIPLDEALPIAKQIAEALEYAHDQGVIHRDLKPANVKITREGTVKLLDFGLAKALDEDPASSEGRNSPTMSLAATRMGVILGTAAYMAPEQAKGKPVDRRADIWAFGVVLYEMLTGRQLFSGESAAETLASVMKDEPALDGLPAATPPGVRKLLGRCLDKDPKRRLQAIGEARVAIEEELTTPSRGALGPAGGVALSPARPSRPLAWSVAGMLAIIAAVALAGWWRAARPVDHPLMRLSVHLGPDAVAAGNIPAAISPDGTRLVFPSRSPDGRQMLATRLLDQASQTLLPGTESGTDPFFSPDGQWVGFFADGKMKKVSVQGGAPVTLCETTTTPWGASWGEDGNIIAALPPATGLSRVPAAGGTPQRLTRPGDRGELTHRWPQILPGGGAVLFTASTSNIAFEDASIEVLYMKTGEKKTVLSGGYFGRYVPTGGSSGYLVYVHEGTLFGVPFDPARLELKGTAAPLLPDVAGDPGTGAGQFGYSTGGTFVYRSGKVSTPTWPVVWLDSSGKTQTLLAKPGYYTSPRVSPDGERLTFRNGTGMSGGAKGDIFVYEWRRDTLSRLTFTNQENFYPTWTPDGRHIVFRSPSSSGSSYLQWIRADGAGEPQHLLEISYSAVPYSFSPDGRRLAYNEQTLDTGWDLWTLPLDLTDPERPKPGKPEPFLRTPANERRPAFSLDGRWIAYDSDESGKSELYVRPFPGPGGKWQISTGGGQFPIWSRNGRELFFETPDGYIMVVTFTASGDSFAARKPHPWSDKQIRSTGAVLNYDLAPDGKRFAVYPMPETTAETSGPVHVTFLLNFFDELRRRVPPPGN